MSPEKFLVAAHTLNTTPPNCCLERTQTVPITVHQLQLDAAVGRSPGRCHQVWDFLALAFLPFLDLSSRPEALRGGWGLWKDYAHLPHDPRTCVSKHLCLQQDRD